MKILIFSHLFHPAVDGGSQILLKLALTLAKTKKAQVKVLTSDAFLTDDFIGPNKQRVPGETGKLFNFQILRIKTSRFWRKALKLLQILVPFKKAKELLAIFQTGPVFLKLPWKQISKLRPKIIVAGVFPTTVPIYAWLIAKLFKAKLVLLPCFHINDQNFYRFPLISILKRANLVLALSDFEKDFYINQLALKANQVFVYHPPLEKSLLIGKKKAKFSPNRNLVFLGNQAAHKRLELLIDVFSEIAKKDSGVSLIIAGQRTLYSPVIDRYLKRIPGGIFKRIKIYNSFPENFKKKILDQGWAMVLPSVHESLGLVFLEAWARKKPVIAADTPVARQVIDNGRDGFLFEKDNRLDLKRKILKLIKNRGLASKMGQVGYNKVKALDNSNLVKKRIISLIKDEAGK